MLYYINRQLIWIFLGSIQLNSLEDCSKHALFHIKGWKKEKSEGPFDCNWCTWLWSRSRWIRSLQTLWKPWKTQKQRSQNLSTSCKQNPQNKQIQMSRHKHLHDCRQQISTLSSLQKYIDQQKYSEWQIPMDRWGLQQTTTSQRTWCVFSGLRVWVFLSFTDKLQLWRQKLNP